MALDLGVLNLAGVEGQCFQLTATVEMSDGTFQDVTSQAIWNTDDAGVATVDSQGLVQAIGPGQSQVSATFDTVSASIPVDIQAAGNLRIDLPCGPVAAGSTFDAPVTLDAGSSPLGAYAIRVGYDPAVLQILEIRGGSHPTFSPMPSFDGATFNSGDTLFAAYQSDSLTSPVGTVGVAVVRFQAVGTAGSSSVVSLAADQLLSTDLTDLSSSNVSMSVEVVP